MRRILRELPPPQFPRHFGHPPIPRLHTLGAFEAVVDGEHMLPLAACCKKQGQWGLVAALPICFRA